MSKMKTTEIRISNWVIYIIIALLMIVVFCGIYGIRILNPTYTDWLMQGGDLTQHYLGWRASRISEWTFPICNTDYLSYPDEMSIIFTDSIPCCAVLFKCLSPILPQDFQYFGFWGLACYILTGVVSAKIINRFTESKIIVIIASLLFSLTPCMIWRLYKHTALGSQWILLLALEPLFAYKQYFNKKRIYIIWSIVGLVASSIHIYFVLMCGIILCGYCIVDIVSFKRLIRSFVSLVLFLLFAAFMVEIGGGFAYLGAGNILLLFISVLLIIKKIVTKQSFCWCWKEIFTVAVVLIVTCILAASPVITFNDRCIYAFEFPEYIIKYWSIFRASGRISWIMVYVLVLTGCRIVCGIKNKRWTAIVLAICVIIQIYDIHNVFSDRHSLYNQKQTYESLLKDESFWNYIGNKDDIQHIILTTREISKEEIYTFTDYALNNEMTINQFYFARNIDDSIVDRNIEDALNNLNKSHLFIFFESNKDRCLQYDLNYYVDEFIVGYKERLDVD